MLKIEGYFKGRKNEFWQQVWSLGIFPYGYLAVLKISRKSVVDSCGTPLVSAKKSENLGHTKPLSPPKKAIYKCCIGIFQSRHKLIRVRSSLRKKG